MDSLAPMLTGVHRMKEPIASLSIIQSRTVVTFRGLVPAAKSIFWVRACQPSNNFGRRARVDFVNQLQLLGFWLRMILKSQRIYSSNSKIIVAMVTI